MNRTVYNESCGCFACRNLGKDERRINISLLLLKGLFQQFSQSSFHPRHYYRLSIGRPLIGNTRYINIQLKHVCKIIRFPFIVNLIEWVLVVGGRLSPHGVGAFRSGVKKLIRIHSIELFLHPEFDIIKSNDKSL